MGMTTVLRMQTHFRAVHTHGKNNTNKIKKSPCWRTSRSRTMRSCLCVSALVSPETGARNRSTILTQPINIELIKGWLA